MEELYTNNKRWYKGEFYLGKYHGHGILNRGDSYRWSPITRRHYTEMGDFIHMNRHGDFKFYDPEMNLWEIEFENNIPIRLIKDHSHDQRFKDIIKDYKSYGLYEMFLKNRDKINQVINYIKERMGDKQDEIDLEKVCEDLTGIYTSYETKIANQEVFSRTQWRFVMVNDAKFDDLLENIGDDYYRLLGEEQKFNPRDVYSGLLESQEQLIRWVRDNKLSLQKLNKDMMSSQDSIKQLQNEIDEIKNSYIEFKDTHLKSNELHPQSHLSILFKRLDKMFSEHQSAFNEIQAQIEHVTYVIQFRIDEALTELMSKEEADKLLLQDFGE